MGNRKPAFLTKRVEGFLGIHAKIPGIGPDITRDKSRGVKGIGIGVFNRGDIRCADPDITLDIQKSGKHVFERSVAWEIEEIVGRPGDVPQGQCRIGLADPANVCFVPARLSVAA